MKNIYLLLVALFLSFSGFSQTTIYQENFEAFGNGAVTTSTTNSDIGVWNSSGTALCNGTTFWGIYDTGSGIITNRGLKPATATTACVVSPGNYNLTSTVSNLFAYTTISTTGYTNISLEFDWKCKGENIGTTVYDYGSVVYRVGTTGSWIQLTTGGTTVGKYYNNISTTAPRAVISLPATVNNLTKIQFGFRWDNDSSAGAAPAFSIDNIIVKGTSTNCTGTPAAGTTVVSPTSGVPGSTYNVTATGTSTGNGLSFQWQSNTNNAGWVNVGSATSTYTALATQTAPAIGTVVQWRLMTTCTNSTLSNTSSVATFTSTYCTVASSNVNFEYISNFKLNTINNTSTGAFYTYYSAISTDLGQGTQYTVTITPTWPGASQYNEGYGVWIDFNQDGAFADPGERVITIAPSQTNPVTGTFTIPTNAALGTTRMRVIMNDQATQAPCTSFTYGEVEDYNVNITLPITYTYNNAWAPFDPNSRSTALNNIIVANGNATISSNIPANSVIVNPTGALTVNTGNTLTVSNGLNLQSNSTQYSSLVLNGNISGTVNYTRHVNAGSVAGVGGNDLISAPLSGQAFSAFKLANGNIKTNTAGTLNLFGPFQKSVGNPGVFLTYANGESAVLAAGEGYRAASTDNGGFIFTGTVNTGTVNRVIDNVGSTFAPWNLIGNPYPSYLYVKEETGAGAHPGFINVNLAQFAPNYVALYGYDNDTSDGNNYTIWNLANTTSSTAITPGQGFFVASGPGGGSVDFTSGMRAIGNTDDFIAGRQRDDENNASLRLNLTNGTDNYVTDFFFNDASTLGLDPGYDAGLFGGSTPGFSIFSQLVEDNVGVNMAIQSLPYSILDSEVVVPIGLRVSQGQQVTISSANNTIPSGVEVYLEDTVANTSTLISNSDYVFTTDSDLNGVGRFYLRFTSTTLSTPEATLNGLQIYTTTSPRALFIKGPLAMATTVSLYDIQGRMVLSSVLDAASNVNQVDVSKLSSGVYVVKLNNSAQQKTQKVILK